MTPERWQRVKSLLQSALERDPDDRAAFLDRECGDDMDLRRDVESLISSHQKANQFIEAPAFEVLAESLAESESLVNRDLGPYKIDSRIGAGGMGEVYLAHDARLGRKVAVKVLLGHYTRDEERVRRFQQEARAASALNHPNILTIYEIGEVDSRHYMVTELIEGQTLRQQLVKSKIETLEALEISIQIASALTAAHAASIVHRDIKPDNVMVRADGIVKVLDFGLAKLTEPSSVGAEDSTVVNTKQGTVMGTSHYMSPEQARGLPVDERTDIWSLGILLYETVGGRLPFEGVTSMDVVTSILHKEPPALTRYSPDIPNELEWIVSKALRKDRDDRYQTARELLSDLKNLKRKIEFQQDLERSSDPDSKTVTIDRTSGRFQDPQLRSLSATRSSSSVIDSLAVLPLVNETNDPEMEYFSDGISESLINALSQLSELRVMAWTTVSPYKGKNLEPRQIGRSLGVRSILTGRVTTLREQVLIKTELVDAFDGSHLWGQVYKCAPSEILDVENDISRRISENLLVRLTTEERKQLTKRYTNNVDAYHAYLKGRHVWNKRKEEDVRQSIEYFKEAIEIDPSYALAYSGLADAYLILGGFGLCSVSPHDAFPKARDAATRALEIDDTLSEAHASLANALANYYWDWPAAESEFKRSLELKPTYATGRHWYAFLYLVAHCRFDEAITEERKALELEPLSLAISTDLGMIYYAARQYDEAIAQYRRTLELDKNFLYTNWQLGLSYEMKADYDNAIAQYLKAVEISGGTTLTRALLGRGYAISGRRAEAVKVLNELSDLANHKYVSAYRVAAIYAALKETDKAFDWLELAFKDRDGWLIWLNCDPLFDDLRSDARFENLARRIGLTPLSASKFTTTSDSGIPPHGSEIASVPDTASKPFLRPSNILWIAGAMVFLIGVTYFIWYRFRERRPETASKNFSFTQLTNQSGPEFFPSLSPDGKSVVYASRASGNWDIYLQRVGGRNPINLTANSLADDTQPAFSPDGERIAFRSEREGAGIYLMGATGESVIRVSELGYSPSWSPDGTHLVVGTEKIPQPSTRPSTSQLWKIDVRTGQRQMISAGDALQPSWSPHNYRIAYWSRPSKVGQREAVFTIPAGGGDPVAVTDGSISELNPAWSPDGAYLYFSSSRGGSVNIWRVAVDEQSGQTTSQPEAVTTIGAATSALHISFSRDGRKLVYIAQEEKRNLRKVSFDPVALKVSSEPVPITTGSMQLWFPDASPDGQWLTAYSMGQDRHIHILRTDGSELRDLTNDEYRYFWPRWSPDGNRIAFSSRRTGNYEIWIINRDGSGLQQLTQTNGGHYSPWSADGKMIAYSIHAPTNECVIFDPTRPWNDQSRQSLTRLSDPNLSFEGWSWSRDMKRLAGIKHLPNGVHSGIGIYDMQSQTYDWLTDFGDWPIWLNDNRHLLFVSQGKLFLFDTKSRKHQPLLTVTEQDVDIGSAGLSPDNRVIYFTFVTTEADIWVMNLN